MRLVGLALALGGCESEQVATPVRDLGAASLRADAGARGGRWVGPSVVVACDPVVPAFAWLDPRGGYAIWPVTYGCEVTVAGATEAHLSAEAGHIDWLVPLDAGGRGRGEGLAQLEGPRDVDAADYERALGFPTAGGRNPRDGLVRVLAWVAAPEPFWDVDGDGRYDLGAGDYQTPDQDLAEPFVDANDDGQRQPEESYRDVNGNGRYDGPDGRWNPDSATWTSTTVLWVGPPVPEVALVCTPACTEGADLSPDHRCAGAALVLPAGPTELAVTAALTDANGNCPGAGGTWAVSRASDRARVEGMIELADCFGPEGPAGPTVAATFAYPEGPVDDRVFFELAAADAVEDQRPTTRRWRICR